MLYLTNSHFDLELDAQGVASLRRPVDRGNTQFIRQGERMFGFKLLYGSEGCLYQMDSETAASSAAVTCGDFTGNAEIVYDDPAKNLVVTSRFDLDSELLWELRVRNTGKTPVELLDLSTPLPTNTHFDWGVSAADKIIGHCFLGGNGSFFYLKRCDGFAPFLVMTPQGDTGFEYMELVEGRIGHQEEHNGEFYGEKKETFASYYFLSRKAGEKAAEGGTKWALEHHSRLILPGEETSFVLRMSWAESEEEVRSILRKNGGVDVWSAPGYTVPRGTEVKLSLGSRWSDLRVIVQYADKTVVKELPSAGDGRKVYSLKFSALGQNTVTLQYDGDKTMVLQYFITEDLDTLFEKRAQFLIKTQCRDKDKWYYALYQEWNNRTEIAANPDNYDDIKGWRIYEVASDDAAFGKPAYMAAKVEVAPQQDEIDSLDDYIEYYVWGGLQMTEEEEYPYAIFGTPDWYAHRISDDPGPGLTSRGAQLHFWRIYDYPHIFCMYFSMYKVARDYPALKTRLTKEEYLERAYRTAIAMYVYPLEVDGWTAEETGLMNERVVPEIVDELERTGKAQWAQRLRLHWERKTKNFVSGKIDLFGSEYPFDTTGFETTHAMADWALPRSVTEEDHFGLPRRWPMTRPQTLKFYEQQLRYNFSCRGTIEPTYFHFGSDYRGRNYAAVLSYMSQMGGWSILDHALYHADDPWYDLRVGYGSVLSSWAVINSGDAESNYGYWFPGESLDGTACGVYEPLPFGTTWLGQEHRGGMWYYSGEADCGFFAGVRAMATVFAKDPLFGWTTYGGNCEIGEDGVCEVTSLDGVGRRFHVLSDKVRLHLLLEQGKIGTVKVSDEGCRIEIPLDTAREKGAQLMLQLWDQMGHSVELMADGKPVALYGEHGETVLPIENDCMNLVITLK